jgi:G3E family GTPase
LSSAVAFPLEPSTAAPIDTVLITGFPGAGKTTLINGWLAQRPPGARWAVLLNETGGIAIDPGPQPPEGPAEVEVTEVNGGCACCAARVAFATTLTRLLRRGPWDRLFVETTGLGHPARLLDPLRTGALGARLRVRPPVAVIDATRSAVYLDPARPGHATAADHVALARLVVLNRAGSDTASAALAARLTAMPPWPATVFTTPHGAVSLEAVDAALERLEADPGAVADPTALQRRWSAADLFDRARLMATLDALIAPGGALSDHGVLRGHGVFRTGRAWYAWRWADGRSDWNETAWRADSRLEVLARRPLDPQMVDRALQTAIEKG